LREPGGHNRASDIYGGLPPSGTADWPMASRAPAPEAVTTGSGERTAAGSNGRRRVLPSIARTPPAIGAEVFQDGLEGAAKGLRVRQPEQPAEGVVTGQAILKAQEFPKKTLPIRSKFRKIHAGLCPADRGRQRNHRKVQKRMALRIPRPRVGNRTQNRQK
jgi:hypothetical protein